MTIRPSIPSDARALVADGAPDAQNAADAALVSIGGTALFKEQIGANDHRAVLWFMGQTSMDPVVHLTPALRIAFEGMARLQQRGDRRQALCAAAQQYCHTQHGFGASANALQSVWNGTGPQVYAAAIENLPGFDALDDAIKDDLLAVAHLDDVPMLDTTVKRVRMPDYALALPSLGESVLSVRAERVAALQRAAGDDVAADIPGTASASLLMQFPRG
ncbi:hypothetical protein [Robbsia sp. KACC 23696]|uniref:hypothetical protein n=1 Tax=Robbsia sp. KACC 23696 TaxID=3149231 RepID=UPI00325A6332